MLLDALVLLLWLVKTARDLVVAFMDRLSSPFRGLPTVVDRLDSSHPDGGRMGRRVVSMRHPFRLLLGAFRPPSERRAWLEQKILSLPETPEYVYAMRYWDAAGMQRVLLTSSPALALGLGPAHAARGPRVISATHAGIDVTPIVSPLFGGYEARELFAYVRHETKRSLGEVAGSTIYVLDSRLEETVYTYANAYTTSPK
jgi:hypothetical protein